LISVGFTGAYALTAHNLANFLQDYVGIIHWSTHVYKILTYEYVEILKPAWRQLFQGSCRDFLGACLPDLKFVSLAILDLLAFNVKKFTWPKISHGSCPDFPGSMLTKN